MRESVVEAYLAKRIKEIGGKCYKWVCPGERGVPDRICLLKAGMHFFVETKRPDGKLRVQQEYRISNIKALDHKVYVAYDKNDVDQIIAKVINEIQSKKLSRRDN